VLLSCRIQHELVREQSIFVKFTFKVREPVAETDNMLRESYVDSLSQTMTYKWFKRFEDGRISTDDDEQSGQPSTSRSKPLTAQVKNIVSENH
jgi:hypothetical protein